MAYYYANTFSGNGIYHPIPHWEENYHFLILRGLPQSAVTIFLHDTVSDLKIHDIPVKVYLSCVYPNTPDMIILPSLRQVIINGNNLESFFNKMRENSSEDNLSMEEMDFTKFCDHNLLGHYKKSIIELKEKLLFFHKEGLQLLKLLPYHPYEIGELTREMLLLFQSLFPVTAENTGQPEKVLVSSITTSGWLSKIEELTSSLKRRYILKSSTNFATTFFKLAESRVHNLKMKCQMLVNPLKPDQIDGILFPQEKQVILAENSYKLLSKRSDDIELYFRNDDFTREKENFDQKLKMAIDSLKRAHSYREKMDEYYWYTLDLDQLFLQRRRLVHKLLAMCDGQELWEYFL